jgi:uncharacterized protein YyaL (SSP411 family)
MQALGAGNEVFGKNGFVAGHNDGADGGTLTRTTSGFVLVLLIALAGALSTSSRAQDAAKPGRIPEAQPGAPVFSPELRERLSKELVARGPDYVPRTRNVRTDGSPLYSNRLLFEASPYLRQHAHNPVNWYPWGDEAFADAKERGVPVLVSIGYSTCHWCHVMEEESFDDPKLAKYLNAHFVAIKVDRETRPDVDAIYMAAVRAMGSRTGWPLNVWVTPEREPFYGGTYFPPQASRGRLGFREVLESIHKQYTEEHDDVARTAKTISRRVVAGLEGVYADTSRIPRTTAVQAVSDRFKKITDPNWGGVGRRTKFPSSVPIRLLLRNYRRTQDADLLRVITLTLDKMAAGGIYDQLGGGFHRYSTEIRWLVPHFEKMLYDNARLASTYLEAYLVTRDKNYSRIAREILDYVEREMTAPEGGFYSATDADSKNPEGEMEEGWFFTWTPDEMATAVGPEMARILGAWYGVTPTGNFEKGRSILQRWRAPEGVAKELSISVDELAAQVEAGRAELYRKRLLRQQPLRDEKILVAWNGLMISAFAQAGFAFDEVRYIRLAERAANFILERMRKDGRLARVFQDGHADGPAFLEDYALLIAGLLDLYEAAPDPRWLREARGLQKVLDEHYADFQGGAYFKTADDHEHLLAREKPKRDGVVPSGNSVSALNLLRLAEYGGPGDPYNQAMMLFSAFHNVLDTTAGSVTELLLAVEYYHDATKEIVVVAPGEGAELELAKMLAPLRATHNPNRVISVVRQGADLEAHAAEVSLLEGKYAIGGKVTAYVCVDRVCEYPTSDPKKFAEQLREVRK